MFPIDFQGSNRVMRKPKSMTDEECMPLYAMEGEDQNGNNYFVECWQPSKEDIEAIVAGRPIFIQILSYGLPPISIWTNDENNEPNV